jgi:CubicO group peptidase (beta-lactamase class C family)
LLRWAWRTVHPPAFLDFKAKIGVPARGFPVNLPSSHEGETKKMNAPHWAAGDFISYFGDRAMHYRNKWYVLRDKDIALGLGVYGQNVFVDKANELVIAKVSSQTPPLDKDLIDLTIKFVEAMSDNLVRTTA